MTTADIGDHPAIARTMATGYPGNEEYPVCPECGRECSVVYRNSFGVIVGCDECMDALSAQEVDECFPGRR